MSFQPEKITREHILKTLSEIDSEVIGIRPSTKFDVLYEGKLYPPKDVMRRAHLHATGEYLWIPGGGEPTNKYLKALGFEIKRKSSTLREELYPYIEKYKILISSSKLYSEIYKWELLTNFKKNWNINSDDLNGMLELSFPGNHNLWASNQYYPIGMLKGFAQTNPTAVKLAISNLLDESENLSDRIIEYKKAMDLLLIEDNKARGTNSKMHYQDGRAIGLLLGFTHPEKYYLFKFNILKSFCKKFSLPDIKKGDIINQILINQDISNQVKEILLDDNELIKLHKERLTDKSYKEDDYHLLTQDFIYSIVKYLNDVSIDEDEKNEEIDNTDNNENNLMSLNQILYGPPGTGKTYNSINKAISIINPNFDLSQERKIVKAEFDRLIVEGQIVFTTFHQSMSYEDFIEGIKPKIDEDDNENKQVIYEIEDGIFKSLVNNAKKVKTTSKEVVENYSFDDAWDDLVNDAERNLEDNKPLVLSIQTPNLGLKIVEISERGNLKLKPIYSDDAKEYTVSYLRTKKLQEVFPDLSLIKNIDKEFRAVIGGSNSTAYWSILNYINQKININSKVVKQDKELPAIPHVLIIDEINRGNVSQIFGEMITLIEDSKRLGEVEALEVTLSYSKKKFGVPSNVYIIGTMNTADRSVEALDTALRRRFSFVEMMPELEIVEKENFKDFDRVSIMQKINQRVEVLLDRNYTLGHSYFIKEDFKNSFENEIMPLLQEYFYNDYGKIGLVLGKGFVREKAITAKNDKSIFADFDTKNEVDIIKSYELIPFKDIDFDIALETLLA